MTAQEIVTQMTPALPLPTLYVQALQCARKMVKLGKGDWELEKQIVTGVCTFTKDGKHKTLVPPASGEAYM